MLVNVTVSVPENSVGDLYRYAAQLVEAVPGEATTPAEPGDTGVRMRPGWGQRAVREAYLGGVSDAWRPFLEALASRADEWVPWPDLCEAVGMERRQAAGMLGAAERRCGGRPPYEKRYRAGEREFRMPEQVATVIRQLADSAVDWD